MSLRDCHIPDVKGFIFKHDPDVFQFTNAFYIPRTAREPDCEFGLYDQLGRLIMQSANFHSSPSQPKGQSYLSPLSPASDYPEIEDGIYGGSIGLHYGHFITECLNRIWYLGKIRQPGRKLIFHSSHTVVELFKVSWLADLMRYAGVLQEDVIIPSFATRIRNLVVPGPAFGENQHGHRIFARFCNELGNRAVADATVNFDGLVFLSRTRVKTGSVKILNENELTDALSREGVEIVHPEEMTIADQIRLFRDTPCVMGMLGSAFHTSIFTPQPTGIALSVNSSISSNYPIFDTLNDASISYVYDDATERIGAVPGFFHAYVLRDPLEVCRSLMRLADGVRNARAAASQPSKLVTTDVPSIKGVALQTEAECRQGSSAAYLLSLTGERLGLARNNGKLVCHREASKDETVPVVAIRQEDVCFVIGLSETAPVLVLSSDDLISPVLSYIQETFEGGIALRHPRTGLYLSLVPLRSGGEASIRAERVQAWELFRYEPIISLPADGRFAQIVAGLDKSRCFVSDDDVSMVFSGMPSVLRSVLRVRRSVYRSC